VNNTRFFHLYNKDEVLQTALSAIEEHNCTKLAEVLLYLPISENLLYEWEPEILGKIHAKINEQKVKIKAKMKKRWFDSDNPALAIAAMKLIADDEEIDALSTSKVKNDNTHSFKDKPTINLIMANGHQINGSSQ
jgi:hypothetical protein